MKDKIVVEVLKPEGKTKGGIIVPETAEREPQGYGRVLSFGEDITSVKEGDIVLFAKFGGQDVLIDQRVLKVLIYGEIYGVLVGVTTQFENLTLGVTSTTSSSS